MKHLQGYKPKGRFYMTCTTCGATIKVGTKAASEHELTSLHTDALAALGTNREPISIAVASAALEGTLSESKSWTANTDECVRLCEAIAAFWGDGVCDAPIWPGAYLTEEDTPIRDLIRSAVGWRKP
jgi:hypothetical protein